MVFGNLGDDCATGVCFTRDPKDGKPGIFGEYLINAQGEDVVAGTRTPQRVAEAGRSPEDPPSMEATQPETYAALLAACTRLEQHFRDMQDIEFTVQQGKLWILQTRNGKRTGPAMVKVAADLVDEGMIEREEALRRLDPEQISELLHPIFEAGATRDTIATGLAASPGAAVGRVVFSADEATEWVERGEHVILVRIETSPEDIQGMLAAEGILTARGGMTSHAAVVARGWGKCCISGCGALTIDYRAGSFSVEVAGQGTVVVERGDTISIDGTSGEVMLGSVPLSEPTLPAEFERLIGWADDVRRLAVRTNADTPEDAAKARSFGAEGIGLCRTEHMLFGEDRILAMRRMILADSEGGRREALAEILPMQRGDFAGIFRAMDGYPVTIRLLDPPLHEFLPHEASEQGEVASRLGVEADDVARRVKALEEFNPMLGLRGVRLAITYPEIYEVQTRAILEAACEVAADGVTVSPEIMVPLVATVTELQSTRKRIIEVAEAVFAERGSRIAFTIGTMIELPRACVTADVIAEQADFFSFGTNDLTQTTFGLSRDDAGRFLPAYVDAQLLERDPFVELDRDGVGELVKIGIERGRSTKPDLKIGICGEHGGNPASVAFCHEAGFDYVSCSPYRVLIARLAAAQAALG
jgi:pyruvate,orthophosphate dikinase